MKTRRIEIGAEGEMLPTVLVCTPPLTVRRKEFENVTKALAIHTARYRQEVIDLNAEMQDELLQVNWTDYYDTGELVHYHSRVSIDIQTKPTNIRK